MYENIILIPYRNREKHLLYFLQNTYPLIQKNIPNSKIVIIEQEEGKKFNKGQLLNIGFKEYINNTKYFITHDVDIHPKKEIINEYNKKNDIYVIFSAHKECLGGISKFSNNTIKSINGFPNNIYGWGIEDRALFYRSYIKKIPVKFSNLCRNNFLFLHHPTNVITYTDEKKKISEIWRKQHINSLNNDEKQHLINFSGINNIEYTIIHKKNILDDIELLKVSIV